MFKELKAFLMRGNIVDLAVAVVIGAAFGAVVTALVEDLITPLIAAIGGQQDFSSLKFTINDSQFLYGDFINKVINFLVVGATIFFVVVKPLNMLAARRAAGAPPADPTTRVCPECLSEVPIAAKRCSHCAQPLPPL
jgi:large conductance mechanosensitive channel